MEKKDLVSKLLAARISSGKTYDELGEGLGLCNVYVAQLFHAQAQLKPETEPKLVKLVPGLSEDQPLKGKPGDQKLFKGTNDKLDALVQTYVDV